MNVQTCSPLAFVQGALAHTTILSLHHARLGWERCFHESCRIGPVMTAETSVFTFHRGRPGI